MPALTIMPPTTGIHLSFQVGAVDRRRALPGPAPARAPPRARPARRPAAAAARRCRLGARVAGRRAGARLARAHAALLGARPRRAATRGRGAGCVRGHGCAAVGCAAPQRSGCRRVGGCHRGRGLHGRRASSGGGKGPADPRRGLNAHLQCLRQEGWIQFPPRRFEPRAFPCLSGRPRRRSGPVTSQGPHGSRHWAASSRKRACDS